jgi:hypothetical protein
LPIGKRVDVEQLISEQVDLIVAHDVDKDGEVRERISEVFKPLAAEEQAKELAGAVS